MVALVKGGHNDWKAGVYSWHHLKKNHTGLWLPHVETENDTK
jgi:hypothetical protein